MFSIFLPNILDFSSLWSTFSESGMKKRREPGSHFFPTMHPSKMAFLSLTGMVDADGDGMLDYSEFVQLFTDKLGLQWKSKAFKQKQKNYILMKKLHNFKKWLILEPGEQWKRRKVQII